jgi:serine/threonine-protein kinase
MLDPQQTRFGQAALSSGLIDADRLGACFQAIPAQKRDTPEHIDRRLAKAAVISRALSLWQAQQLLAGRNKGFKVDRYVLIDVIGQERIGRVYLARDTRTDRRVALKILAPERTNDPGAIARFQREARIGAQLQHENLVRVYDFGESDGRYFLVMDYIEGRTVDTLIAEWGAMPPSTAVEVIRQVAMGLEHVHRKGFVHCDIKPSHILVDHAGTAKLTGLEAAVDLAEVDRNTRGEDIAGSSGSIAPDQEQHALSADVRSDIYSLGCTLYHMLRGFAPFPGTSLPENLYGHLAEEPTPLEQIVHELPDGLAEVVRRMMHKSAEERFARALDVVHALSTF